MGGRMDGGRCGGMDEWKCGQGLVGGWMMESGWWMEGGRIMDEGWKEEGWRCTRAILAVGVHDLACCKCFRCFRCACPSVLGVLGALVQVV